MEVETAQPNIPIAQFGLKRALIRGVLPYLIASIAVVTAWSGAIAWYGGYAFGIGWVTLSEKLIPVVIDGTKIALQTKAAGLQDRREVEIQQSLENSEVAFLKDQGGRNTHSLRSTQSSWTTAQIAQFSSLTKSGFYLDRDGKDLIYAFLVRDSRGKQTRSMILAKKLDHVLEQLKAIGGPEFTLLTPDGDVIKSTMRSMAEEQLFPKFDDAIVTRLIGTSQNPSYSGKGSLEAPNYAGFKAVLGFYHRGESRFQVFFDFFPIRDPDGRICAYIGTLAPQDSILSGPKRGILGSTLLGVLLSALVAFALIRLAARTADPLTEMAGKIELLSCRLLESVGLPPESGDPDRQPAAPYSEIRMLRHNVNAFERIFAKKDEMRKTIDENRSKLFASSKMAALGEMAGGIAHEINSPLAVVTTLSSQLQELMGDAEIDRPMVKQISADIESTALRIAKIIMGLRSFTRDASQDPLVYARVQDIISDTLVFCGDKFRHHDIRLILEETPLELDLFCRPSEISQVILNLLNNAHDAVEKNTERWVRVAVATVSDCVEISIIDSGKGIPQEIIAKLFQPFFTTKSIGRGTGLGLGISRKIAEAHGGTLTYDKESKNTRFSLRLPRTLVSRGGAAA